MVLCSYLLCIDVCGFIVVLVCLFAFVLFIVFAFFEFFWVCVMLLRLVVISGFRLVCSWCVVDLSLGWRKNVGLCLESSSGWLLMICIVISLWFGFGLIAFWFYVTV